VTHTDGRRMERDPEMLEKFASLVDSVGVKRFSQSIGITTRQTNRILAGVQPNPVERLIQSLQAADTQTGDQVLDFVCQEMGGFFVREESLDPAVLNAVKECAEAIAAISDGHVCDLDVKEIREAISALAGLLQALRKEQT
jgi:hypothetical protein